MFPSWDSIEELDKWHNWADGIGHWWPIIVGAVALVIGGIWTTYNRAVDHRLAYLTSKRDQEDRAGEKAALRNDLENVKKVAEVGPTTEGLLTPDKKATPDLGMDPRDEAYPPDSASIIFLGNCIAWNTRFPLTVIQQKTSQSEENMIVLGKEGNGLWVSAKFFDQSGKITCEIVRNHFYVNRRNSFRIDSTPHSLSVFNDEAKRVLYIEFLNNRTIYVLGDFYLRGGTHLVIRPDHIDLPGGGYLSGWVAGETYIAVLTVD